MRQKGKIPMAEKDAKKTMDITIVRPTQRVTRDADGEMVKKHLPVGEELTLPRNEARGFIACKKAIEGKHGAEIKKSLAAAKRKVAA